MRRMPGRAASIAARPLTLTIACAAAFVGVLAAPAPSGLAASSHDSHPARHTAVHPLAASLTRPGPAPNLLAVRQAAAGGQGRAAFKTGIVTGVIHGVAGTPTSELCVTASGVTASGAAGDVVARTTAMGRYVLPGLRPGRYSLVAGECPGTTGALPLGRFWASRLGSVVVRADRIDTMPAGTALRLRPDGLVAGSHPAISPRSAKSDAGSKPGSMSGVVTGEGHKLPGICVAAISLKTDQFRIAVSGKTGRYKLRHLDAGKYLVEFLAGRKRCPNSANWLPEIYKNRTVPTDKNVTIVPVRAGKDTKGINALMKAGGQISGTVRTEAGRPAARVCVDASATFAHEELSDDFVSSGRTGRYVLHGVFPGKYQVLFALGCGNKSNLAAQWWHGSSTQAHATNFIVAAHQHVTGIDASLRPGAVVTGTIRAKTATRKPIPGVCVRASDFGPFFFSPAAVAGKNGHFKLVGLSTGTWGLSFDASCKSAHGANFRPVTLIRRVTSGRTLSGLSVRMRPASGLSGVVTDTQGKPVSGVCVVIADANDDLAVSKADGSYSVKGVPQGRHEVEFSGGCGSKGSLAPQFYNGQASEQSASKVTFVAGRIIGGVDAMLRPGGTITGVVTDTAGQPVRFSCVGANTPGDLEDLGGLEQLTSSDRTGHYRIANISPGAYEIGAGCGFGRFAGQLFPAKPDLSQASWVSVPAGSTTNVDFTHLQRSGSITGTVTSSAGRPLALVCVAVADARTKQLVLPAFEEGFTGRHGGYKIRGLTPGRYLVDFSDCALGSRFASQWFGHKAAEASSTPVTVRPAKTTSGIDATMTAGGAISGRVTGSTGKPLAQICVFAYDTADNTFAEVQVNKAGDYTLKALATGHYAVNVAPCGAKSTLGSVTLPSVAVKAGVTTKGVNVKLTPGGSIAGTVSTSGLTSSAANICVIAIPTVGQNFSAEFAAGREVETGPNGNFTIGQLAPGTYKVVFDDSFCDFSDLPPVLAPTWDSGKLTQLQADKVKVTAASTTSGVDAALETFTQWSGTVESAGHPVAGACVTAVPQGPATPDPAAGTPPRPEVAITGHSGRYTLVGVQPGAYKIKFSAGCGAAGFVTQWWAGSPSEAKGTALLAEPGHDQAHLDATLHK